MKNTQNLNSKYFSHRTELPLGCVSSFLLYHLIIIFPETLYVTWEQNVTLQSVQSENASRHLALIREANSLPWFQHSKYWQVDVSHSVLNALPQINCVRVNQSGLILCRCSAAASNKPLPMTNRACHFWLSVRLLVFHMCSSGSFAASEIIICKDEGLSGGAAGLWQQPFHLSLLSATPFLFLLQSLSSLLPSHCSCLFFSVSQCQHLILFHPFVFGRSLFFWWPYFAPPRLFCLCSFHYIFISCISPFCLAHNLWFWCRFSGTQPLWSVQIMLWCKRDSTLAESCQMGFWSMKCSRTHRDWNRCATLQIQLSEFSYRS